MIVFILQTTNLRLREIIHIDLKTHIYVNAPLSQDSVPIFLTIVASFVQAGYGFLGEVVTKQIENKYISSSKFGIEDILKYKAGPRVAYPRRHRPEIRSCSNQTPSPISAPCPQHPQSAET